MAGATPALACILSGRFFPETSSDARGPVSSGSPGFCRLLGILHPLSIKTFAARVGTYAFQDTIGGTSFYSDRQQSLNAKISFRPRLLTGATATLSGLERFGTMPHGQI